MAEHVYHWKHGWIPLDHAAASLKAHGDKTEAHKLLVNAEVAKVAAGEKDVKHAQRTIDHAHGYAGKSVSELSDNQLKHEQLRAKDMHRFATGEEDKRTALAHHRDVQAELEKRGHKTGRSVPVKSQEQKREEFKKRQAVANAAFEANRAKPAGESKPKGESLTRSSVPDASLRELAKSFRPGDRVTGTDAHGNTVTGRLEHPSTATRLKKARPFPGQKPFDTPGPRYDNSWTIRADDGSLPAVDPHSVKKVEAPSHAEGDRIKPGKLKKGDVVEHPQTGKPVEVGEIHNVIGGSRAAGSGKYVISDTNGHQIAEMSPNSSLKRAAKPEHVRAAEQFAGAKAEADRRRAGQAEDHNPFKAVEGNSDLPSKSDTELRAEREALSSKGLLSAPEEDRLAAIKKEMAARDAEDAAFERRHKNRMDRVASGERLSPAADQLYSDAAHTTGDKAFDSAVNRLRVQGNKEGWSDSEAHKKLTELVRSQDMRDVNLSRTMMQFKDKHVNRSSKVAFAAAESKVVGTPKEKRVVGAPAGHQLIDTGKKSAGGSNNVIELRTDTGHTVGTLERVDREVPRRTGAIATSFKKETSWRLTYPGQGGGSSEYSYEKTRARAAADLLRRANPGKAAGR